MNPVIIIPAYNPPKTFMSLLENIHLITSSPIIIIDDGSIPIIDLADNNTILLRNKNNSGKGFSLLRGFKEAFDMGYSHAITMDADSQHDQNILQSFIEIDENISFVLGYRQFNTIMPLHRRISNKLTSSVISYICQEQILDSQCGYRRYKLDNVCSETYLEHGFQFESEVLIKLLCNNCTLHQIEIPTIYSQENSSMNIFLDTIKFIRLIIRCLIRV